MSQARFAAYFTPIPGSRLARFGAAMLGYDCDTGNEVPQPGLDGSDPAAMARTAAEPARYGFHGTLMAPFELAPGRSADDLMVALDAFAGSRAPVPLGRLMVDRIGAFIALVDALLADKPPKTGGTPLPPLKSIIRDSVAAVSVGLLDDTELLDLNYSEDKDAEVDMSLVMTGAGQFVEVQGSGEEATFSRGQLDRLLKLGKLGIDAVTRRQRQALGSHWPLD